MSAPAGRKAVAPQKSAAPRRVPGRTTRMTPLDALAPLLRLFVTAQVRLTRTGQDRGDVPGWVLVTIMTAGLVTVLWALAGDRLQTILDDALSSVTGPGAG